MQCDAKSLLTILRSREVLRRSSFWEKLRPGRPRRLRVRATEKKGAIGVDVLVVEDDVDCMAKVDGVDTK